MKRDCQPQTSAPTPSSTGVTFKICWAEGQVRGLEKIFHRKSEWLKPTSIFVLHPCTFFCIFSLGLSVLDLTALTTIVSTWIKSTSDWSPDRKVPSEALGVRLAVLWWWRSIVRTNLNTLLVHYRVWKTKGKKKDKTNSILQAWILE